MRYVPVALGIAITLPACVFWDMGSWSSEYGTVVLHDAPLAYWPLDDAADAPSVKDASGNGHDCAVSGDVTLHVDGIGAGAALFTNGRLDAGTAFGFAVGAPYSLEGWVKPTFAAGDGSYRAVVSRETSTPTRNGYDLWFQAAPDARFGFEQNVAGTGTSVIATLPGPDVLYIVVTYDGSNESIHINGSLAASGPAPAPPDVDTHFLWGASAAFPGNFFTGTLDELAVYGRVLDEPQIKHHWQAGLAAAP